MVTYSWGPRPRCRLRHGQPIIGSIIGFGRALVLIGLHDGTAADTRLSHAAPWVYLGILPRARRLRGSSWVPVLVMSTPILT
eukprot:4446025-Alexandrium_andersonii.AAC.1